MSDAVLLRFRDLTADVNTIEAHNSVARQHGSVYWGWWKKPPELMPDPALTLVADELRSRPGFAYLINSADKSLYRATLTSIRYSPGGPEVSAPEPDLCPAYYRTKPLPAWFKLGVIEPASLSVLDEHVFSTSNRHAFKKTITAMQREEIGQVVSDIDFLDSNVSLWFISPNTGLELTERFPAVRSLSRGVWPIKGRYALHLSDLHFGVHHVFRNELASPTMPRVANESLAEALFSDLEAVGISHQEIALLLITGDLTWSADSHEFANAQKFVSTLTNAFGLHVSQVVVVPGNHDIEWRDEKGDVDPNAELNFAAFSHQIYGTDPDPTFLRMHQYQILGRNVCIIALNSCRLESRQNAGLGFVGREQLGVASRFLRDTTTSSPQLRLALLHHQLLPVNFIEGVDLESKRGSMTLDAEAVIRSLICAKVRVAFHGHQHQPYVAELRRIIRGFVNPLKPLSNEPGDQTDELDGTLAIVGAGSIGVDRGHLNVVGRNCYNIIDFGDMHAISIKTRVQSPVGPGFSDYQKVSFAC